jgi:hypothetical protein
LKYRSPKRAILSPVRSHPRPSLLYQYCFLAFAMSFLMPSQRGFEHSQQDLPELNSPIQSSHNRVHHIQPQTSFEGYSSQPGPPSSAPPHSPMPSGEHPPYPTHDANGQLLPKVGQTRCCESQLSLETLAIVLRSLRSTFARSFAETYSVLYFCYQ